MPATFPQPQPQPQPQPRPQPQPGRAPILLAVAHGTRSPAGQAQVRALIDSIARRRPLLDIRLSYVDVQEPRISAAVTRLDGPSVVVPLLLSSGYHVRVDIGSCIAGADAVISAPLGPDRRLIDLLHLEVAGAGPADAVVLAAAGSADPRARADVDTVAVGLARRLRVPVRVGYAAAAAPRVPDVVATLRRAGARRVVIAAYLLVDGVFYRSLRGAGADAVTAPLATSHTIADIVLDRYDSCDSTAYAPPPRRAGLHRVLPDARGEPVGGRPRLSA